MSKNYKGGYKIIDLKNIALLSGGKIDGIYERIESSYSKPLLLTGIVIDDVEKNDVYINELKVVDGSFVFKAYGYEITIDDEDNVEAVEIHVPEIKSVISAQGEKTIDIKDGDEYLLSSTHNSGTTFNLPKECYLVGDLSTLGTSGDIIVGFESHLSDSTTIQVAKNKEVYIKRVGNMILVSISYGI